MSATPTAINKRDRLGWLDRFGMIASMICAVHCVAVGLIAGALPLVGLAVTLNWIWEIAFLASAIILGGYTIWRSFLIHRKVLPLLMAGSGILLLGVSKLGHLVAHGHMHHHDHMHLHWNETAMSVLGGLLIAAAHLVNMRYRSACKHPGHKHAAESNAASPLPAEAVGSEQGVDIV